MKFHYAKSFAPALRGSQHAIWPSLDVANCLAIPAFRFAAQICRAIYRVKFRSLLSITFALYFPPKNSRFAIMITIATGATKRSEKYQILNPSSPISAPKSPRRRCASITKPTNIAEVSAPRGSMTFELTKSKQSKKLAPKSLNLLA